jgi:multidrug/hemolysin transport system permease protein
MNMLNVLVKRNIKLFFKDKGLLFTSLITPLILLVLYATFLSNVYKDSFMMNIPTFVVVEERLINACVGGQLISSLLAVSCVTVAFCSNMLMIQDKITGTRKDLLITPVTKSTLALSYYLATIFVTLIICFVAISAGLIYLACIGWYLRVVDIFLLLLDVFILVLFGTSISSIVNSFLSSQGQISAVGSIVSSAYGFICGAYMPISSFGDGLQKVVSFLPGTYGTSLLRNHALGGVFEEMSAQGFSSEVITGIKDSIDCNLYFFGDKVQSWVGYLVLGVSVVVLIGAYILIHKSRKDK